MFTFYAPGRGLSLIFMASPLCLSDFDSISTFQMMSDLFSNSIFCCIQNAFFKLFVRRCRESLVPYRFYHSLISLTNKTWPSLHAALSFDAIQRKVSHFWQSPWWRRNKSCKHEVSQSLPRPLFDSSSFCNYLNYIEWKIQRRTFPETNKF